MTIRGLIEAIERGEATMTDFDDALPPDGTPFKNAPQSIASIDAGLAYSGSLDAAKRLHDALLPGWVITIERVNSGRWMATLRLEPRVGTVRANDDDGARAWLLAILRALEGDA
jgi:hypothetical protein